MQFIKDIRLTLFTLAVQRIRLEAELQAGSAFLSAKKQELRLIELEIDRLERALERDDTRCSS